MMQMYLRKVLSKKTRKKLLFVCVVKVTDRIRIRQSKVRIRIRTEPRIRIRTEMSRIQNTGCEQQAAFVKHEKQYILSFNIFLFFLCSGHFPALSCRMLRFITRGRSQRNQEGLSINQTCLPSFFRQLSASKAAKTERCLPYLDPSFQSNWN